MRGRVCIEEECIFFFNDTATTEIYTLSLHDALPIFRRVRRQWPSFLLQPAASDRVGHGVGAGCGRRGPLARGAFGHRAARSEEHTSELQSRQYLVCRLLLEKKNINITPL